MLELKAHEKVVLHIWDLSNLHWVRAKKKQQQQQKSWIIFVPWVSFEWNENKYLKCLMRCLSKKLECTITMWWKMRSSREINFNWILQLNLISSGFSQALRGICSPPSGKGEFSMHPQHPLSELFCNLFELHFVEHTFITLDAFVDGWLHRWKKRNTLSLVKIYSVCNCPWKVNKTFISGFRFVCKVSSPGTKMSAKQLSVLITEWADESGYRFC